jgi:outer membrane protein OmpA-like peptidoglycan-associated protein
MKKLSFVICFSLLLVLSGCSSFTRTQKGGAIGTASGGAVGAVIGRASGNTAMGAIIGAVVGGTAGAIIGNQMDKQAAEIARDIPDAKVTRVEEGIVVEFSSQVLFGFDQSDLNAESRSSLDKLVRVLNGYPDTDIEIQGHTDSDGTVAYNKRLSERRALAVSNYLTSRNIVPSRITVVGYGELAPKYSNEDASGKALNRRVEFLISANEKMRREAIQSTSN